MQTLYNRVVEHPHPMYSLPKGKVVNNFILLFAEEFAKVRPREHNLERALFLPAVIL